MSYDIGNVKKLLTTTMPAQAQVNDNQNTHSFNKSHRKPPY